MTLTLTSKSHKSHDWLWLWFWLWLWLWKVTKSQKSHKVEAKFSRISDSRQTRCTTFHSYLQVRGDIRLSKFSTFLAFDFTFGTSKLEIFLIIQAKKYLFPEILYTSFQTWNSSPLNRILPTLPLSVVSNDLVCSQIVSFSTMKYIS